MSTHNDFKEHIVYPAWEVIRSDSKVKKFYFLPGLLSIILLTTLLVYQSIYTYVVIFGKKEKALEIILEFFHSGYFLEIIVSAIIFMIIYTFLIPIFEGGLIKYLDEKHNGRYISTIDALGLGLVRFLPLFEYNNAFSEFKYISLLNAYLFLIRFVGLEYIVFLNYVVLGAFLISTLINVLFAYAKYEMVLKNKGVFQSIGVSAKISILNLKNTLKLYVLMFIINIRVLLNFLIFLFFPILFAVAISYFTTKLFLTIAIILISILFIFFIFFLGYLTAVLDVFKTSIWYFAYINGRKRFEEDDHDHGHDDKADSHHH
nr:hypothetical protein [Candidatus Gracilibacteria bacterium]